MPTAPQADSTALALFMETAALNTPTVVLLQRIAELVAKLGSASAILRLRLSNLLRPRPKHCHRLPLNQAVLLRLTQHHLR
jgi:hypothetical protein